MAARSGGDSGPSLNPHAIEDAGALLQRLDRTGLDMDDLIGLAWIVGVVIRDEEMAGL